MVGDSFAYIATDLENVSDRVSYTWNNPMERMTLIHQSFLPHGYGLLVVQDAGGLRGRLDAARVPAGNGEPGRGARPVDHHHHLCSGMGPRAILPHAADG